MSDTGAGTASVHKLRLSDPNEIGHHSEWEFDFRQIEPGPPTTIVIGRAGRQVALTEFKFDRSFHQKGCSPNDTINFGLPVTPILHSWRETKIDTPGIVNFGTGSEFDCVTGPDFVGVSVSFAPALFERVSDQLGLTIPDNLRRKNILPVRRRTTALMQFAKTARALLHFNNAPFGKLQEEELAAGIISGASDSEHFDDRSAFSPRAKAVTRAIEIMQVRLEGDLPIGQLCVEAGTSWRTLTRGFHERFGIGPKAYFNRLRLARVRAELMRRSCADNIADAANNWGFWHMGQFAKDYQRTFGELPSVTLNRTKNQVVHNRKRA